MDIDELEKRFWEEADKEESFDLGELALYYVPELEGKIKSLQQEIKRLQDVNISIRNWNACEEEDYKRLIESDKLRIQLEEQVKHKDAALGQAKELFLRIRDNPKLWKSGGAGGQDKYAGLPPFIRMIDDFFKKINGLSVMGGTDK